jgi:hypothetical protein
VDISHCEFVAYKILSIILQVVDLLVHQPTFGYKEIAKRCRVSDGYVRNMDLHFQAELSLLPPHRGGLRAGRVRLCAPELEVIFRGNPTSILLICSKSMQTIAWLVRLHPCSWMSHYARALAQVNPAHQPVSLSIIHRAFKKLSISRCGD